MRKRKQVPELPADQELWSRKRLRITNQQLVPLSRPGPFFEHLHHDIRNLIYKYLNSSAPLRYLDLPGHYSGFAETCHHAKQDADEEGRRQFWMYLKERIKIHLRRTGDTLRLPKQLQSKHDLAGITSLTIIHEAPPPPLVCTTVLHMAFISLKTVNIHYTGVGPAPPDIAEGVWDNLVSFIGYMDHRRKYPGPEYLTLSWDYRDTKCKAMLDGIRYALCHQKKRWIYATFQPTDETLRKWPVIIRANDAGETSGSVTLQAGSRSGLAWAGLLMLTLAINTYGFRLNPYFQTSYIAVKHELVE